MRFGDIWRRGRVVLAVFSLVGAMMPAHAADTAATAIQVGVPQNPPFAGVEDGRATGLAVVPALHILREMGYDPQVQAMTPPEIYAGLAAETLDVGVPVLATPERVLHAYFTDPLYTNYTILLTREKVRPHLRTISALSHYTLGGRTGFRYPRLDCSQEEALVRLDSDAALAKAVAAGDLDAALIGLVDSEPRLRAAGLLQGLTLVRTALDTVPLSVGLSHKRFTRADMEAFNARLSRYHQGKAWIDLLKAHGLYPPRRLDFLPH